MFYVIFYPKEITTDPLFSPPFFTAKVFFSNLKSTLDGKIDPNVRNECHKNITDD